MTVRVYLYNGSFINMKVNPGTTVNQLQKSIGQKLRLGETEQYFRLFECRSDNRLIE